METEDVGGGGKLGVGVGAAVRVVDLLLDFPKEDRKDFNIILFVFCDLCFQNVSILHICKTQIATQNLFTTSLR